MSVSKHILLGLLAASLMMAFGCADGNIDDGDSADVILSVQQLMVPIVTAATDPLTGVCTLTVTDATATLKNDPKNSFASNAFTDVQMSSVTVTYVWDDPALTTPTATFVVSGTIVVNGSGSVTFPPVNLGDLDSTFSGHSANLVMVFAGNTVEGTGVTTNGGGVLSVNSCP